MYIGYLDYLRKSLQNPAGSDTGLVSEEENQMIRGTATEEIRLEIEKYEKILRELLESRTEIERYIFSLRRWIPILKMGVEDDPNEQPIEELKILAKLGNDKAIQNLEETEKEIEKYSKLLLKM